MGERLNFGFEEDLGSAGVMPYVEEKYVSPEPIAPEVPASAAAGSTDKGTDDANTQKYYGDVEDDDDQE